MKTDYFIWWNNFFLFFCSVFAKALEQFVEYPQRVGEIFNQFVSAAVDSDLTHDHGHTVVCSC